MSQKKQQVALKFGQRALFINGIYATSFVSGWIPFVWDLLVPKPFAELSEVGIANTNFFNATVCWLGILNISLSNSNNYQIIKQTLLINSIGFASWFAFDIYHHQNLENAFNKLFYYGVAPISCLSMLYSYYAYNKLKNAEDE